MNIDRELAYAQRFERVFDYIERHLCEVLDVEQLSRVAHFSKFHFHRQFTLYAGIGISAYVRRVRLRHASYRLVFRKHERITDIALEVGFENPESFSRAFRQAFGQPGFAFMLKAALPYLGAAQTDPGLCGGKRESDMGGLF